MVGYMQIFDKQPNDWKDLQNKVAHVLQVCGYKVETPKKIQTPRETIEVDVYAENSEFKIVCECKYWKSNVPQSVVHSFRTVVLDIGANKGIIIAQSGFQRGAYNSVQNTNIELRTWPTFLLEYTDKYLTVYAKRFESVKRRLFRVCTDKSEYLMAFNSLDKKEQRIADQYKNKLLKVVEVLILLCSPLIEEDDNGVAFWIGYINDIIMEAEDTFGVHFTCYYSFMQYLYNQICDITPKLERMYKMDILPKSFYYDWYTC